MNSPTEMSHNHSTGYKGTPGLRLFLRLLSRSRFRPRRVWSCGCVVGFGWMVVRFVRVIRVPACARVSLVSRVPCVSRLPPVSFYRVPEPKFPIFPSERSEPPNVGSGSQGLQSTFVSLPGCLSPADPSQTTALAASEEVETDAAVLAAGETEVGECGRAYIREKLYDC